MLTGRRTTSRTVACRPCLAIGIGVVFTGLVCIVILCKIMSALCSLGKNNSAPKKDAAPAPAVEPIANRQEIIAAVSAVIAEDLGTDVSAIRILSFKKI